MLDIQGKGDMRGSMENSKARVRMRATKFVKNGQTYLKFEKFQIKIQIGKNLLHLDNLFNGELSRMLEVLHKTFYWFVFTYIWLNLNILDFSSRLFSGDPTLGQIGNQFINENSELFLSEILPGLENNLAAIFTSTANEVVAKASYDEMFPDTPPKSRQG